jgi:hypothetical protein
VAFRFISVAIEPGRPQLNPNDPTAVLLGRMRCRRGSAAVEGIPMTVRPRSARPRVSGYLRTAVPLVVAAGSAALLTGCGSSSSPTSGSSGTTTPPAPSGSGTTVNASETEFHITLSQSSFQPGSYTFQARNDGKFPHALNVDGPGVEDQATPTLAPGQSGAVTVALQAGAYTIYCPVDGHRGKGMQMQITVAAAAAPTASPASQGSGGGGGGY